MIDRVRNTVLTILNKENRGTIPPAEFNRLAGLAQRSIFEDNFYDYSKFINMQNQRMTNSEYSDIPKNIREKIDVFASSTDLTYSGGFFSIDVDDFYRLIQLRHNNAIIEETPKSIITMLNNEQYSAPSLTYPVFVKYDGKYEVFPDTIQSDVTALYIRKPKTPKWTFIEVGGNPVYNPSANDFQDIELHPSDETRLIIKILGYCGVTLRDQQVIETAYNREVNKDNNEQ